MSTEKVARFLMVSSVVGLTMIALSLGIVPEETVPYLYDTPDLENVNQIQLLRANMGAIFASIGIWIVGLTIKKYFIFATVHMTFYMVCIALSRILGFLVDDGTPTFLLLLYFSMEITFSIVGFFIIRKWRKEGRLVF